MVEARTGRPMIGPGSLKGRLWVRVERGDLTAAAMMAAVGGAVLRRATRPAHGVEIADEGVAAGGRSGGRG